MRLYKNLRFLAIIPARGGSKGVPRKNIRFLAGKPLIAWTMEEAKRSRYLDRCIVSTEDEEIKKVAEEYGGEVPFLRPPELAQDGTASIDVVLDVLHRLPGYDFVVLLQPTSPLRTAEDIDGAIAFCLDHGAESCVSVAEAEHSPYWMYTLDAGGRMQHLPGMAKEDGYQRQRLPKVYRLNGAVYVKQVDALRERQAFIDGNTIGYAMSQNRSYDIDTMEDFEIAEMVMRRQGRA